jgi:alpha-N-acetylglucosamine transferase
MIGFNFSSRRTVTATVLATLVTICLVFSLRTTSYDPISLWKSGGANHNPERLAYALLMASSIDQSEDLENDHYFVAARIVIWQLLHNPSTKTTNGADVFVMVTPDVSASRIERLKKDGVKIRPVEVVHTPNDHWVVPEQPRLVAMMAKLRLWEMTEYSRILFLDSDFVLRSSLDGVFDDPGTQRMRTLDKATSNFTQLEGEAPLPETYLLASLPETSDSNHDFPPTNIATPQYMNGGFFMLAPDLVMFEHMKSLMDIEYSFNQKYMEQSLINYVHRKEGPMPWAETKEQWCIRYPNENDFEKGLVSMHEKWWKQPYIYDNDKVKDYLKAVRWEMKGWYDGRESGRS